MKWSWKLMRIAGIDVFVHATFFLLILWVAINYWQIGHSVSAVISGVVFILALFVCVVLHEFGHAMMARHFGFETRHITLLPIGGVASFEKLPEDPKEEILVALAGPAVNVLIAGLIGLGLKIYGTPIALEQIDLTKGFSWEGLFIINITLVIFNMLPAFPMDGGRVFRGLLAFKMEHHEATRIAAKTGQAFALMLGMLGVVFNPFLVIIALFVWMGAASETSMEYIKSRLVNVKASQAMITEFHMLSPNATLSQAVEFTLAGSQTEFPIVQDNNLVGVLTQQGLIRGLHEQGGQGHAGEFADINVMTSPAQEPLQSVFDTLIAQKCRLAAVTRGEKLVGILDVQNIMEYVSLHPKWPSQKPFHVT